MSDADAALIALAEGRVQKAVEVIARHRLRMARLALSGRALDGEADILGLFEANLAIFEEHLALLSEPPPVPAPPRR